MNDLISRKDAIERLKGMLRASKANLDDNPDLADEPLGPFPEDTETFGSFYAKEWRAYEMAIEALEQPERRGKWIYKRLDNFRKYEVVCSECGARYVGNYNAYDEPDEFNFCPSCGARMEAEE